MGRKAIGMKSFFDGGCYEILGYSLSITEKGMRMIVYPGHINRLNNWGLKLSEITIIATADLTIDCNSSGKAEHLVKVISQEHFSVL